MGLLDQIEQSKRGLLGNVAQKQLERGLLAPRMQQRTPGSSPEARIAQGPIGQWADKALSGGYLRENVDRWNAAMANSKAQAFEGAPDNGLGSIMDYFAPMAMTAFHGSPYKFDKFSLDNIGTGEGAQAYGHGLYFAENPKVAGQYAAEVKDIGAVKDINKQLTDLSKIMEADSVGGQYRKFRTHKGEEAAMQYDALLSSRNKISEAPGHLYEVDIPDEHVKNFLDWDVPLGEQAEGVRKALGVGETPPTVKEFTKYRDFLTKKYGTMKNQAMREPAEKEQMLRLRNNAERYGFGKDTDGGSFVHQLEMKLGSKAKASEYLNSLGIKGIKYFDGSSRAAGEGTRNLVVFDDSIVKTLKRNNKPVGLLDDTPEMLKRQSGLAEQDYVQTDKIPDMLKRQSGLIDDAKKEYPLADIGEWWGDANYKDAGGEMVMMKPDDFLKLDKKLDPTEELTAENIQDLIDHVSSGRKLDPPVIPSKGRIDGRHRALMAKQLGIEEIPVIKYPRQE